MENLPFCLSGISLTHEFTCETADVLFGYIRSMCQLQTMWMSVNQKKKILLQFRYSFTFSMGSMVHGSYNQNSGRIPILLWRKWTKCLWHFSHHLLCVYVLMNLMEKNAWKKDIKKIPKWIISVFFFFAVVVYCFLFLMKSS